MGAFVCYVAVDDKPSMSYCLVTTRSRNGSSTDKVEISCEKEDTVVYSIFLPDLFEVSGLLTSLVAMREIIHV